MTANTKGLRLSDFSRVVFFTGAGMSAESGVPTYRGSGGVWEAYDWESYACQRAFDRDPERVWDFHDMRRQMTAACEPHAGHRLITEFESAAPNTVVVTQNIDGMHQKAGSHTVHELHGSLWRVRCSGCSAIEENHEVPLSSRRHSCGQSGQHTANSSPPSRPSTSDSRNVCFNSWAKVVSARSPSA